MDQFYTDTLNAMTWRYVSRKAPIAFFEEKKQQQKTNGTGDHNNAHPRAGNRFRAAAVASQGPSAVYVLKTERPLQWTVRHSSTFFFFFFFHGNILKKQTQQKQFAISSSWLQQARPRCLRLATRHKPRLAIPLAMTELLFEGLRGGTHTHTHTHTYISQIAAGRAGVLNFARRKILYLWQEVRKIDLVVGWRLILGPFMWSAQLWESA